MSNSDRRTRERFPLRRAVRYTLMNGSEVIGRGAGCTLNLSSKGAAFTTTERLRTGASIEISVSWPAALDGRCPLRLVAYGYVVRSTPRTAACRILKFQFRAQAQSEGPVYDIQTGQPAAGGRPSATVSGRRPTNC